MTLRVGVVDYGMGNLRSVAKAWEAAGASVCVADNPQSLKKVSLLTVPGVGAFDAAVQELRRKKLDGFIREWVQADRPFLGICLGLQLLFDSSQEAPGTPGLGLLPGVVVRFRPKDAALKVPHMGWNQVSFNSPRKGAYYYFVHSYYPRPRENSDVWCRTEYGAPFCSGVRRGRLTAVQFHPEKSGVTGLQFLKERLAEAASC